VPSSPEPELDNPAEAVLLASLDDIIAEAFTAQQSPLDPVS
jgi:hypothetical protein